MRDLFVQASSDTVGATERTAMGNQLAAMKAEIDRIAAKTTFNGTPLLDGTFVGPPDSSNHPTSKRFQTGDSGGDFINFSINQNFNTSSLGAAQQNVVAKLFLSTSAVAANSLTIMDQFVTPIVTTQLQQIGSMMQRVRLIENQLSVATTNTTAAKSRIVDADVAQEQASSTRLTIVKQLATAQLAHANLAPQGVLALFR